MEQSVGAKTLVGRYGLGEFPGTTGEIGKTITPEVIK